ncbi:MAG: biotin-dependent carboxyltransferase family protein [Flavobacteriaceae bacterium]|nr:biotin-dependent carboxyltransferase family protein [Flavobacteriaceae bacterium]
MIEIVNPGIYTSVQDGGRIGFYSSGVPISGFMDQQSAQLTNLILNNPPNTALLESTSLGPVIKFHETTHICFGGAMVSPRLNDRIEVPLYKPIEVKKGDLLSVGYNLIGNYSYLAIAGGIQSQIFLDSMSMSRRVTSSFRLTKNQRFTIGHSSFEYFTGTEIKSDNGILLENSIQVYEGPEYKHLTKNQIIELFNKTFKVLNSSNRIAYLLDEKLKNKLSPILSNPVLSGTVQLTPGGELIVLMRDCQTSGGYPRILQLTQEAINILAQKQPNSKIKFKKTDFE